MLNGEMEVATVCLTVALAVSSLSLVASAFANTSVANTRNLRENKKPNYLKISSNCCK